MAYDEAHPKRSRVVVETPAARREVLETRTAYAAPERRGVSTGVVAIVAIAAVMLTAIVVWALTRPTEEPVTTTRVVTQPTPITQVVTVPVPQQQPVVMPPATTTTTTQPIIVPVPSTTTTETVKSNDNDDSTIQSNIEKKFSDDPKVAALGITVSVVGGKVTLIGTVDSREMKNRVERMARIKGVKRVDNQITVNADSTAAAR
ncbi:MAG TPA: BON domain-containing protein [Pyrinomonadaceae bacterium]